MHGALLALHRVRASLSGTHVERVGARAAAAQREVECNAEVRRVAAAIPTCATPYFVDAATFGDRELEIDPERLRDEAERIDEVALPGAVRPYEEREPVELDIARLKALVVLQPDAPDERIGHRDPNRRSSRVAQGGHVLDPTLAGHESERWPRKAWRQTSSVASDVTELPAMVECRILIDIM